MPVPLSLVRSTAWWGVCCCMMFCVGCGTPDGPPRYNLSGLVTFEGQPVPIGEIRFSPDSQKGNQGPATLAKIEKGQYATQPERGGIGGPMIVQISGYDGIPFRDGSDMNEYGKPLFQPYRVQVELPMDETEQDFEVPQSKSK